MFLDKEKKLMIFILIIYITNNIKKSTIYIILKINTRIKKNFTIKINIL